MKTTFTLGKNIISKVILSVMTFALVLSGSLTQASAQSQASVDIQVSGNQYWVTCYEPAGGKAIVIVTVRLDLIGGTAFGGTRPITKYVEIPLRNVSGSKSEPVAVPGLQRAQIHSVRMLR